MDDVEAMTRDELLHRVLELIHEAKTADWRILSRVLETQLEGVFGDMCGLHSNMYEDNCIRRKGHDGYHMTLGEQQWQVIPGKS